MLTAERLPISSPTSIRQEFCQVADRVEKSIRKGSSEFGELLHLADLLESLPLSTEEFNVAQNRVRNASRYLRSGERGAAQYELRMLFGSIRQTSRLADARRTRTLVGT